MRLWIHFRHNINSMAWIASTILYTFISTSPVYASIGQPVAIDSRIKTLIYSPNEVFKLKFVVGYQSIIELEKDEEVDLIAFGDPLPWNVKVVGKRVFVKAIDPGIQTNMTLVTNKRTYLMEISSINLDEVYLDDQLVYVVRFFYPEVDPDKPRPIIKRIPQLDKELPQPNISPTERAKEKESINFNYTFAGNGRNIIPVRVFDNGRKTFLQFSQHIMPSIYVVNPDGTESPIQHKMIKNYVVIDRVTHQLSLRYGPEIICVFNEMLINHQSSRE